MQIAMLTSSLALAALASAAGAAPAAAAATWNMTSWTGASCLSGKVGHWAVGPNTDSCITFANVLSLKVGRAGPCTTVYYHDNACATAPFLANPGICDGFDGAPVGSFHVNCTA